MISALEVAESLRDSGYACIPVNDQKIPVLKAWGIYRNILPSEDNIHTWFRAGNNIALVGGKVQCIDFDEKYSPEIFKEFCRLSKDFELYDIIQRCIIQKTPSGGHHIFFRSTPNLKNTKLALCEDGKVAIETRGEGGYFLIAPSKGYEIQQGVLLDIPEITEGERDALLELARFLDKKPKAKEIHTSNVDITPGDDYDERGDVFDLLTRHGWTQCGKDLWRRPDKKSGISASFNYIPNRFWVFSTSTDFEAEHAYKPWHVYAVLECGGDYKLAATQLSRLGYGSKVNQADYDSPKRIEESISFKKEFEPKFPPIYSHSEADKIDDYTAIPKEIIKGVLHQSCKLILSAPSKARKSWLMLDLGASVASGSSWLGFQTNPMPTLYIDFELKSGLFAQRRRAVFDAKFEKDKHIPFYELCVRGIKFTYKDLTKYVKDFIKDKGIGFVIYDPVYKMMQGRDENKASDVADMLFDFEQFASEENVAIAFAHHYAKGNSSAKESIDRASGSGVWARDPDALMMLTPHEVEDSYVVESHLRNFPPQPPFCITWNTPLWERNPILNPEDLKGDIKDKKSTKRKTLSAIDLKEIMKIMGIDKITKENATTLAKVCGVSKATILRRYYDIKGSEE